MLKAGLGKHGYEIETAFDGLQALARVRQRMPNLIVLDIMMPNMDGTEVAGRLKEDPATRHIPIIFLSALWQENSNKTGEAKPQKNIGFAKPFQLAEVLAKIQALIGPAKG
jgi:CheY-like chemotaxis protein